MNRRQRLMATLRGEVVDRPPVSFYELNGLDEDPSNPDTFNIYSDPSWQPLIDLAREKTDRIVIRGIYSADFLPEPAADQCHTHTYWKGDSYYTVRSVRVGQRQLSTRTRRDKDVNTLWTEEALLKTSEDIDLYLQLPENEKAHAFDMSDILATEKILGDSGIVMLDTPDPLCLAASLFDMADYLVIAMSEKQVFRKLLDRFAEELYPLIEEVSSRLPGRLWRIYGPEYASPPYLPPEYFREFVCEYVRPMIRMIQQHGGYARIHSHGNLKAILDDIVDMNADGLDPVEPPPQGDVQLSYVRRHYGRNMVLFGNIEICDIENLPTDQFAQVVHKALEEGTAGNGRGFVLMPSACPIGRQLSSLSLRNYEKMIEIIEEL